MFTQHSISVYGDKYQFIWNIWWVNKCVMEFKDIYTIDYLFYPFSFSGAFHTFAIFPILLTMPFYHIFGAVFVYNLIVFLSFLLAGIFMFKLIYYFTKESKSAFIAGMIFAFNPARVRLASSGGYFNMFFDAFVPLFILYFYKMLETRKYKYTILSAILFSSIFYTGYQITIYTAVSAVMIYLYIFIREINKRKVLLKLISHGFVFSAIVLFFAVPVFLQLDNFDYEEVTHTQEDNIARMDLFLYSSSALFRGKLYRYIAQMFPGPSAYLMPAFGWTGLILIVLSIFFIKSYKGGWLWLFIMTVYFLLSFGPHFRISPRIDFSCPAPFILFTKIPVLNAIRAPWRIVTFVFFSMAVFIGIFYHRIIAGLSNRINRLKSKEISNYLHGIIIILIIAEFINIPFNSSRDHDIIPVAYDIIKKDTEDCSILEMPVSWIWAKGNVDQFPMEYMYYPSYHKKRMINGYVSKLPPYVFSYFINLPLFRVFIEKQGGADPKQELILEAKDIAHGFVRLANLKYIMVHRKRLEGLLYRYEGRDFIPEYLDLIREIFPISEEISDDRGNILFILDNSKNQERSIYRMTDRDIKAYLLKGAFSLSHGDYRWFISDHVKLGFPNHERSYKKLKIYGYPFVIEGKTQNISIFINKRLAYTGDLSDEPSFIAIDLKKEDFKEPILYMDFEFSYCLSPFESGQSDDKRRLSYSLREIIFE